LATLFCALKKIIAVDTSFDFIFAFMVEGNFKPVQIIKNQESEL